MGEAVKKGSMVTIERAMKDLPPLPMAVSKIIQLTNSANSSAGEIDKVISSDQAISTKVLRVVNTPYFGLSGQVSSISQAIIILGFDQVRNLVLSLSSAKLFEAKTPESKQIQFALWKHAFATATAAQLLGRAKRLDPKDQDFVFSSGLLSNIGALFLASQFNRPYGALFKSYTDGQAILSSLEDKTFGANHAEIGQQLCAAWKLPHDLALLVGRHEGPFAADPIPTLFVVHAADRLARLLCLDQSFTTEGCSIDAEVFKWLRLSEKDLEEILSQTKVKLEEVAELLGLFA